MYSRRSSIALVIADRRSWLGHAFGGVVLGNEHHDDIRGGHVNALQLLGQVLAL